MREVPANVSRILCLALVLLLAGSFAASAQTYPTDQRMQSFSLDSGMRSNAAPDEAVVWSEVVDQPGAPWLRLTFRRVELDFGSSIRITSLLDGEVQDLNEVSLEQWQHSSAYFNGDAVRVELVAGPNTRRNLVEVGDLVVGLVPDGSRSQCGPTDDRVASNEPERARLLNIGCTASIYNTDSCFITAGHCLSSAGFVNVVEFNVPISNPDGSLNHPPVSDQYAVDAAGRQFVNGGVGNDWGLFRVFPNTQTNLMPFDAQGAHLTLGSTNPPVGSTIEIVGYGVDTGSANQTQQVSTGPLTFTSSNNLSYQSDTTGGNSGSSVLLLPSREVVAVHSHGGCSTGGGGANQGTAINQAGLQAALATFCPTTGGGGIQCNEIDRFQARCVQRTQGNLLQMRVILTSSAHSGDTVTFDVDGTQQAVTIQGDRARLQIPNATGGAHVISLVDPAGCVNPQTVTCP